ncbi:hypothetical protein B0T10DRAFT_209387 [Thelonectria olida]|uniref:HTH La-type RNA-binding domain-containing protein n=1 Tax=Thelonectria olida TaxID=1576542 RepID=A0A9P9AQI8_9HYPO|nr:hypothetical protein B0T10DRAFT_209387 [Thelonectria olida]
MTTVSSTNTSEMSASTFSYAQAAKGQGTAPPSNTAATTGTQPQDAQDAQAPDVSVAATKTTAPDVEQVQSTEVTETPNGVDPQPAALEKGEIEPAPGSESDARSESTQDRRSESRRDEETSRLDRPWRRNDKPARSSSTTTRSTDEQDSRKARRNKKSKASEKQASDSASVDKEQEAVPEPPKVELSEAPIPSVNIWHKRKEAHLAKGKPATAELANGQQESSKGSAKASEDVATQNGPATNGVKPHRKSVDAPRPERNGPRGSRLSDKEVPPPVEDAVAWPTPDTSIKEVKEEKKKSVERADRSDKDSQEDGSQSKPRQKKEWKAYDYVPSVSFETQLPQMRNSKTRGGARSGRDAGPRATSNGVPEKAQAAPLNKVTDSKTREVNGSNGASSQPQAAKRGSLDGSSNQKKAVGADKAKDATTQSNENVQASRPEGRGERGRGGFRGRGAHPSVNTQVQHNGAAAGFNGQVPAGARAQGPYSPPLRQGSHGQMFGPQAPRGRGGRNGAGNYHRMSLPNGQARMPAVQPQFPSYDYSMPHMAGVPFQPHPYWDNVVVSMLRSQIEYYFSIENLCKDMYLRARMDSQGFVPLHFVAAFKRMRELSPDTGLIRAVCEESTDVEYVVGEDDCERLRRRDGWQQFVLPMEDRDELARNHGPAHLTIKNRAYAFNNHFNGMPQAHYYPTDPSFPQYHDGAQVAPAVNGFHETNGSSQLSADVPDFSPSGSLPLVSLENKDVKSEAVSELPNGHTDAPLTNGVHAEQPEAVQS